MKKTKFAYLAGLIDGEGCFCISRQRNQQYDCWVYFRTFVVANTDYSLMQWLVSTFGGRIKASSTRNIDKHKRRYVWLPRGKEEFEKVVLGVIPYLVIKRRQAEIFLQFIREDRAVQSDRRAARLDRKEKMYFEMRKLNRKGPVETDTQGDKSSMIQSELMGDHESAPVETPVCQNT